LCIHYRFALSTALDTTRQPHSRFIQFIGRLAAFHPRTRRRSSGNLKNDSAIVPLARGPPDHFGNRTGDAII
jgi:hypothetical protein